jgi:hypothetical protein
MLMDARTFDRWTVAVATCRTRRGELRLLVGSLFGALLAPDGAAPSRAAQRDDRDGDGLFDDDETGVYGTDPDNPDSDGDGVDDGQEVYDGTDPLTPQGGAGCGVGQADCGAGCIDIAANPANCGGCGIVCDTGYECVGGACQIPEILVNDDVTTQTNDQLVCSAQGLTDCYGACADLTSDFNNCGICGYICAPGDICLNGTCTPEACAPSTTNCDNRCTDLNNDQLNCGACGNRCADGLLCCNGACVNIANDPNNCGGCGRACFTPLIGDATCENYACT